MNKKLRSFPLLFKLKNHLNEITSNDFSSAENDINSPLNSTVRPFQSEIAYPGQDRRGVDFKQQHNQPLQTRGAP